MDGSVAVQSHAQNQGFFHMPRLQVPSYQKPRVFVSMNTNQPPSSDGGHSGPQVPNATQLSGGTALDAMFDGKRIRKSMVRRTVDYNTAVVKYLENRVWQRDWRDARAVQPDALYQLEMTPPANMQQKPMNCLTSKFMRQSTNKFRCPIFCISWTPEGRRLVTGASSGEFTLWNGLTFSFETILQAHETSVRAMVWSHNDQWMVTADHAGFIKYWQTNMNNVKMYQGHKEPIRSISFCPTDSKFASCSDDGTVRVWDFLRCYEEKILRGHGADVKCVDWHPQKALIASGSKDNQVPIKLWDPKSGQSLATLHAHKFTVMDIKWNQNGNWLLTAARDHLMKLFDIRNLKEELQVFKGHKKEATAVAWHPINEQMFASGGSDGAIMFWNAGTEKEVGAIEEAHEAIIWDLAWHPLGHVLTSASNDHSTKFWTRNRPGDAMRDKYNLNIMTVGPDGEMLDIDPDVPLGEVKSVLPGMGLEHGLPPEPEIIKNDNEEEELPSIPGLDWSSDAQYFKEQNKVEERPRKKAPYSRPIPKSFEQAWVTNQQPVNLIKDNESKPKKGKIKSLLSLDIPAKLPSRDDGNDRDFNPVSLPDDHNPYLDDDDDDGGFGQTDEDFRGDQDFRQDQDMRGDQDFRGDIDFRSAEAGPPGFGSMGPPQGMAPNQKGMDNMSQGQYGNSGSNKGGQNFRGRGGGGGPRRDRDRDRDHKRRRDSDRDRDRRSDNFDDFDNGDRDRNKMRKSRSSLLGEKPGKDSQGQYQRRSESNDRDYNESEDRDFRKRDSSPGPRNRGRGNRARGRGGNSRFDDKGRNNFNDESPRGDSSFNDSNDSFDDLNDSRGSGGGGRGKHRGGGGRGKFRGSDNYRGGGSRGGRGRDRGGGGRGRGGGSRGRGRGNRD
ncbi:WD repeat-containing protein 33 [Mactra antiquata]